MKDLVQVDDNNNNKIDMNLILNGMTNGSSTGAIVKATNGYATKNGLSSTQQCSCDKGEWVVALWKS